MSSLDKLAIRGIRSFDDKSVAIMEFYSPVTVIVGHNGSGKTTVIECLKYITTGDQPPNTRGGAFVHDPKMANEKEVKAQVRLRFFAANGTRMLATRNLSVTAKKTGLTMKTLEGILGTADEHGNKRSTISTKCAEMDIEIPRLLGVSKSVLENVIFCHQEESYWPLSEASVLKKKFDDIFEATKYTKALDSIKTLRKERVADLKADKEKLESLKLEKSRADKIKSQISVLQATIGEKEQQLEELEQQCRQLAVSNQRFSENAANYKASLLKVETLVERKTFLQQEADALQESITEIMDDPDLDSKLEDFEPHVAQQEALRSSFKEKLQDEEERVQNFRRKLVHETMNQGQLHAIKQAYEKNVSERTSLVRELAPRYNLRGFEHPTLENSKAEEFVRRLTELLSDQNDNTTRLKAEQSNGLSDYDNRLRKLYDAKSKAEHLLRSDRDAMASTKSDIARFETQLDTFRMVDSELRRVNSELESTEERRARIAENARTAAYQSKLDELSGSIRALEDDREKLDMELQILNKHAESRAALSSKQAELQKKTEFVDSTLLSISPKFRQFVGHDPEVGTLENELAQALREREFDIIDARTAHTNSVTRMKQAEADKFRLEADIKKKKDAVTAGRKKIMEGRGEFASLDAAIRSKTEDLEAARSDLANTSATLQLFMAIQDTGNRLHKCAACDRALSAAELPAFQKYVARRIQKASSTEARQETEEAVESLASELRLLQDLERLALDLQRVETVELPTLARELETAERQLADDVESTDAAFSRLNRADAEYRQVEQLKLDAAQIVRTMVDVQDLQKEVRGLNESLSAGGSSRTVDEVRKELEDITGKLKTANKTKQALSSERDQADQEERAVESQMHRLQLRQRDIQAKIKEKTDVEQRIKESKRKLEGLQQSISQRQEAVSRSEEPIRATERDMQTFKASASAKVDDSAQAAQQLNKHLDRLRSIGAPISEYIEKRKDRELERCEAEVRRIEGEITEGAAAVAEIQHSIARVEKEGSEKNAILSNMKDNQRLRKAKQRIADLEAQISEHDLESMSKAWRQFDEKYLASKAKESAASAKREHTRGELASMSAQLNQLSSDLSTDYKDVYKRYTDQLVTVKMSDLANNDLEKYAKALDNAIMRYHAMKMEEVNDTMKHLWNRTYQGTDIDGIAIRSDNESSTTKRSYNYRVVMTKDQVEMDMRGRCSAGQKMLASIIIRLALSDSFGQNCGILALDEPTNALDTENVDALAASLVDLINERRANSNFQLIVITHDENFLRKLATSDVMEYYWRVSRDARQKSIIERNKIS